MHYDLQVLAEYCDEVGLCYSRSDTTLDVRVEESAVFRFANYIENHLPECACGFAESHDHSHDEPIDFPTDRAAESLTSLDILAGLVDGTLIIWELWDKGDLVSRILVHKLLREDFKYLARGSEIRVRRPAIQFERA